MVLHKQGTQLFHGVRNLVTTHLEAESVRKIVPRFPPQSTASLSSGRADPNAAAAPLSGSPQALVDGKAVKGKGRADVAGGTATGLAHGISNPTDRLALVQAGDQFLKAVKGVWDDHVSCMRKLRDVLKYMVSSLYSLLERGGRPANLEGRRTKCTPPLRGTGIRRCPPSGISAYSSSSNASSVPGTTRLAPLCFPPPWRRFDSTATARRSMPRS